MACGRGTSNGRPRFSMAAVKVIQQPELSKRLFKIIKSENRIISAHETAAGGGIDIAKQLSEWGESTGDDAVSDLSDKFGVLLAEIGEQEYRYAENLDDHRNILKQIRNTESSVQPARDEKTKVTDEIHKLKLKEPGSSRLATLEQELVRAEAKTLVAEAQLTNITRQKLKEAYDVHLAATIERAEKQIILARHGRRILNLLDDTPVVPGDTRQPYDASDQAHQIIIDAEDDLKNWEPQLEPIPSAGGGLGANLMPGRGTEGAPSTEEQGSEGRGASRSSYRKEPREHREGVMGTTKDSVMQAAPTAA
ncbi:hypothetical protein FQN54_007903 [Arachnomyces sp. PD_36]|nr:hypothetical protein FQN54_007903 [Arachnomyces sp. PD_36]